jgi:hypothetical protein
MSGTVIVQHELGHLGAPINDEADNVEVDENGVYYKLNTTDTVEWRYIPWGHVCGIVSDAPFKLNHKGRGKPGKFSVEDED